MVSRRPSLLPTAIQHVMQLLKSEVSHSQDLGDREALLPLLHLFRELLTMVSWSLSLSPTLFPLFLSLTTLYPLMTVPKNISQSILAVPYLPHLVLRFVC